MCPSSVLSLPVLSSLLWAFPRASVRGFSITTIIACTRVGAGSVCARPFHTENSLCSGGRSSAIRASCFAATLGAVISSAHARGLSGRTGESRNIKPYSSPNQICNNGQRVTKKKSICRSTQDSRHGISPKALDLIEKVLMLPDVKEIVSRELDKWEISEGKFSIAYVKQAIQVFEREGNWSRIIQISEWLVRKEEGKTLRTFEVFLKALDMQQRTNEAELVWKNNILKKSWSIPTRLVAYVLNMFERHHKPLEVIKLFTRMEDNGRKMDKKAVKTVARAYEAAGFLEMKKQMLLKYKIRVKPAQELEDCKAHLMA